MVANTHGKNVKPEAIPRPATGSENNLKKAVAKTAMSAAPIHHPD
jgi:hypothetical protein